MKPRNRTRTSLLFLLLIGASASGCATKKDIALLRDDLYRMQQRQDSLNREMQRQTRMLLDTMRQSFDIQRDARGDVAHRFQQLDTAIRSLQELVNQMQLALAELIERLDRQPPAPATMPGGVVPGGNPNPTPTGEVAQALELGKQSLRDSLYQAARGTFRSIVASYPMDPAAAEAQYWLAETYALEMKADSAIAEFVKVEAQWPNNSYFASQALLRAGVVADEIANRKGDARDYYNQVIQRYPTSDAAQIARRRLGGGID